jgi:H+/Cl- antiporter ClcA
MIGVAVAAGTVAAFGTPFGGIISAIELTATFFIVGNLWKCFFCVCVTLIVIKYLYLFKHVSLFSMTNYSVIEIDYELFFFVILGIISGYIAILFNFVMIKMVFLRVRLKNPFIANRWKWSATVALLIALMSFPIP